MRRRTSSAADCHLDKCGYPKIILNAYAGVQPKRMDMSTLTTLIAVSALDEVGRYYKTLGVPGFYPVRTQTSRLQAGRTCSATRGAHWTARAHTPLVHAHGLTQEHCPGLSRRRLLQIHHEQVKISSFSGTPPDQAPPS
jgi:hypothetical protein